MQEMQEAWVREDLEYEMATDFSILAWKFQWPEEPDRLQSKGRKESDMTEQLSTHTQVTKD